MRATIFFLTFSVFIATVVWRVDQVMFGDKLAWGEAQSRAQMSALSHAMDIEIKSLKDLLLLSFTEVEQGKKDFSANRPYSHFQMMSKLLPPNVKDDRKDWQIVSTFFQENSPTKKWAAPYVTLALKTVKEADVKGNAANVYALMDPTRKPYMLLLVRGGANWYAGLLGTEVFQGLMDRQKGQKSTVFVVNMQGQTLGHTTQEYVGTLLTEDPLVAEIMKANVGSGFGTFKNLKDEPVQGLYEQVEGTNVFAVITTPVSALTANRGQVRWQLILMGAGLGLIGLAIFVFSDRGGVPLPRRLVPTPPLVAPAAPVATSVNSANVSSGAEKMKAYTQVASSLSLELRSPLTSILGHTQLAMNQISDSQAISHLQKIESEARGAREIVQKLLIFSGEDKVPAQKMGMETVINKALKHVEGKILSKGVKLTKNIQSVPQFTMAGDLVVKAVENVLINAIEAMERAPKKELNVSLQADGPKILLTITDTGEGISQHDMGKIFDPFFTTRSGSNHVGLGLSTALGIFKEAFGEVQVDSEKGQGTTVKVVFNPQENLLANSVPAEAPKKAPKGAAEIVAPKAPAAPVAPAPVATAEKAPAVAPAANENLFELDPLLVDNTIERLIEDDLPDMPPPPPKIEFTDKKSRKLTPPPRAGGKAEVAPQVTKPAPEAVAKAAPTSAVAPAEEVRIEISESDPEMDLLIDIPKAAAVEAKVEPPTAAPAAPSFSSKIDKPKIEIKKKTSRLDEMQVAVRRPGERL